MTTHSTSLGRKFALLLAFLVGVPTLVCGGLLIHVHAMRRDASRLLEETRESALANELQVRVETVRSILTTEDVVLGARARDDLALEQTRAAIEVLEDLEAAPPSHDPSRDEHQSVETDLLHAIGEDLASVVAWLEAGREDARTEVLDQVEHARRFASVMAEETYRESVLAHSDVGVRARASQRYILGTLATIALVSAAALFLVFRVVLDPIRRLRRGTERLRSGDLEHRILVESDDELGDLGQAFNDMADELGKSHAELERKVDTRTRELVNTARLADVGVLAAGLAHEINTPLASIATCGEGLLHRLEAGRVSPEEEREYLETIVSEAYRTRGITSQLLDLSRPADTASGQVDVPGLVRQAADLTKHLLAKKALRLEVDVAQALPPINGNPGELLQMLLNLILNARDASPDGESIRLRVRAEAKKQAWEIEDCGDGIAPENLERVFDPFFTTKGPGMGTGLGLSLVAAIVDRHGGTIDATNTEQGGARFTVRLPVRPPMRPPMRPREEDEVTR